MKSFVHAAATVVFVLAASTVWAHATLQGSEPPAGSTLTAAPKQLRLHFNEALEPAFASVKLTGPGGKEVAVDKAAVDKADGRTLVLPLPALPAGAYQAKWSAMGHDGHRMKGDLGFTVEP